MKKTNGKLRTIEKLVLEHAELIKKIDQTTREQEDLFKEHERFVKGWTKKHDKLHRYLEQRFKLHYHLINQLGH